MTAPLGCDSTVGTGGFDITGFDADDEGTGICDSGANGCVSEILGIGTTVFSVSGVISVIVLAGSGMGGIIGGALFSFP